MTPNPETNLEGPAGQPPSFPSGENKAGTSEVHGKTGKPEAFPNVVVPEKVEKPEGKKIPVKTTRNSQVNSMKKPKRNLMASDVSKPKESLMAESAQPKAKKMNAEGSKEVDTKTTDKVENLEKSEEPEGLNLDGSSQEIVKEGQGVLSNAEDKAEKGQEIEASNQKSAKEDSPLLKSEKSGSRDGPMGMEVDDAKPPNEKLTETRNKTGSNGLMEGPTDMEIDGMKVVDMQGTEKNTVPSKRGHKAKREQEIEPQCTEKPVGRLKQQKTVRAIASRANEGAKLKAVRPSLANINSKEETMADQKKELKGKAEGGKTEAKESAKEKGEEEESEEEVFRSRNPKLRKRRMVVSSSSSEESEDEEGPNKQSQAGKAPKTAGNVERIAKGRGKPGILPIQQNRNWVPAGRSLATPSAALNRGKPNRQERPVPMRRITQIAEGSVDLYALYKAQHPKPAAPEPPKEEKKLTASQKALQTRKKQKVQEGKPNGKTQRIGGPSAASSERNNVLREKANPQGSKAKPIIGDQKEANPKAQDEAAPSAQPKASPQ